MILSIIDSCKIFRSNVRGKNDEISFYFGVIIPTFGNSLDNEYYLQVNTYE